MGLPFLEETHSVKLALTTQVLQKLLGSVAKETHYFIILCKFVKEKLACLKQSFRGRGLAWYAHGHGFSPQHHQK